MNITLTLIIVILVLTAILIGVINAALNSKKKIKDLEGIIELKNKTIAYLYQNSKEIAEIKLPDLNCYSVEEAMKIVEGTARNMGVTISE